MFICWGGGKAPPQTPPPFVMTQINEIKRNTLPNFIYAFPMSTANLHSSQVYITFVLKTVRIVEINMDMQR